MLPNLPQGGGQDFHQIAWAKAVARDYIAKSKGKGSGSESDSEVRKGFESDSEVRNLATGIYANAKGKGKGMGKNKDKGKGRSSEDEEKGKGEVKGAVKGGEAKGMGIDLTSRALIGEAFMPEALQAQAELRAWAAEPANARWL